MQGSRSGARGVARPGRECYRTRTNFVQLGGAVTRARTRVAVVEGDGSGGSPARGISDDRGDVSVRVAENDRRGTWRGRRRRCSGRDVEAPVCGRRIVARSVVGVPLVVGREAPVPSRGWREGHRSRTRGVAGSRSETHRACTHLVRLRGARGRAGGRSALVEGDGSRRATECGVAGYDGGVTVAVAEDDARRGGRARGR